MIAITIELLISWILLKFIAQQNLSALGLMPDKKVSLILLAGLLLPVCYLTILYLGISVLVGNPYVLNPNYTLGQFIHSSWLVLRGGFYEELLFRGALLYLLYRKWGLGAGLLISGLAFGVYHWFSYGVIGQPLQMLIVLVSTGTMGLLFALSFYKAKTIWLPLVIHLGYNFTSMVIFSIEKQIGAQVFIKSYGVDPVRPEGLLPLLVIVLYYTGFPIFCFLFLLAVKREPVSGK